MSVSLSCSEEVEVHRSGGWGVGGTDEGEEAKNPAGLECVSNRGNSLK